MSAFLIDMLLLSLIIIGICAFMGSITNGIGHALFGRKKDRFIDRDEATTTGWRKVGGTKS